MKIQSILVPVDFSNATPAVVEWAIGAAKAFGARLTLVHITEKASEMVGLEPLPVVDVAPEPDFRAEHRQLQELRQQVVAAGVEVVVEALQGDTRAKILQEAHAQAADLIVVGSHRHGALYQLLVGTVPADLLKKTPCPVVVVPAPPPEPLAGAQQQQAEQ